jgi:hypothetical protein
MHGKSCAHLNYRHGLPAGLSLKAEKELLWLLTDGRSFFSSTKPPHLPQVTGLAANAGERIFIDLNPSG